MRSSKKIDLLKNSIKQVLFFLGSLFLLILTGCSNHDKKTANDGITIFNGTQMTIDYIVMVGKQLDAAEKKVVTAVIDSVFSEIDTVFNKWNSQSELSQLNQLPAGEKRLVSAKMQDFLKEIDQLVYLTENRFDPTIEPLQALWKTYLQKGEIPPSEEIAILAPAIGWHNVHHQEGLFYKDHKLTSMDFSGIAKGLCIDLIIEQLTALGFSSLFVEWGGEIRTAGKHPEGRPWQIFISRLGDTNPHNAIAILSLDNQAIATSGDYLQYWQVNNETYFHVFDPSTLRPLKMHSNSVASASVLAPTCAWADALATAAMLFPSLEEAKAWAQKRQEEQPELSFWLIARENNL